MGYHSAWRSRRLAGESSVSAHEYVRIRLANRAAECVRCVLAHGAAPGGGILIPIRQRLRRVVNPARAADAECRLFRGAGGVVCLPFLAVEMGVGADELLTVRPIPDQRRRG